MTTSMSTTPEPTATPERRANKKTIIWVATTYFAEGLPYMIVRVLSSLYFTRAGLKESVIGFSNFYAIPWTAKFLWAPFLDAIGTKRRWMWIAQVVVGVMLGAIAGLCFRAADAGDATQYVVIIAALFAVMAVASATNDVAIDGYYLEGITDKGDQALYTGHRVMAYRLAVLFARSGLVGVAALAASYGLTVQMQWGWVFGVSALTMLVFGIGHALLVPRFEVDRTKSATAREIAKKFGSAFSSYLSQDRIAISLAFIILYKLGDEMLLSMMQTFLGRELGLSDAQYSLIAGVGGTVCGIFGAYLGGIWIKLKGLRRAILPMMLMMNLNIWAYVWLAHTKPDPNTTEGYAIIAVVYGFEQIVLNCGFSGLVVYLLRMCKPEFKASHYAMGSGISALGGILGGWGGEIVTAYGYTGLYMIAFALSVPAMIMLPWVPMHDEPAPV